MGQFSGTPVRITLEGVGEAKGELVRFSAPITVGTLLGKLPIEGRVHPQKGGYSSIIGIRRGTEKAVRSVKAGTIAYWPMQDALIIYHSYVQAYSPVNTVGKVTENLELFGSLRSGTKIRIERAQSRVLYARVSVLRRSFIIVYDVSTLDQKCIYVCKKGLLESVASSFLCALLSARLYGRPLSMMVYIGMSDIC